MNKCIVTKLGVSVNNANLPTFVDNQITEKNYITTTANNQYIHITDNLASFPMNKVKLYAEYLFKKDNYDKQSAIITRGANSLIGASSAGKISITAGGTNKVLTYTLETDVTAECNALTGTIRVNGTDYTVTPSGSTSSVQYINLLSDNNGNSYAGMLKMKVAKLYNAETGELIFDLRPVLYSGVACVRDYVSGKIYYEANGGTLAVG